MWKRLLMAGMVVAGGLLILPTLDEPKDLEFAAYATIQAQPPGAPRGDKEIYLAAIREAVHNPAAGRELLVAIAISDSEYGAQAREIANAIRSAQIEDNEGYTYTLLGQSLARVEVWDFSVKALEKAVELEPGFAEAWAYLGEARQQVGSEDALETLQHAADLSPLSVSVNLFQALYWQRQGNFDEALRFLQIAHLVEPENPQWLAELGNNQVMAGKVLEARDYYERALELEPNETEWQKLLARYSLGNQVFVEELGLATALRALILEPEDAEAMYLIANAYRQLGGNRALVLDFLEAAIAHDTVYGDAHLLKAIVHLEVGENELARMHLEQVLTSDASAATKAQAAELLETGAQ